MTTTTKWRQLRSFFPRSSAGLAMVAGLAVVSALLVIPVPALVQYMLDDAVPSAKTSRILGAGSILILLLVANEATVLIRRMVIARRTKAATARIRGAALQKLHDVHIQYHQRTEPGQAHEIIVKHSNSIDVMVQELLNTVAPAIVLAAGMAGVLLSIHWGAFLETVLLAPTVYAISRFFQPRIANAQQIHDTGSAALNESVMFSLRAIELTRSGGSEEVDRTRNEGLVDATRSSDEQLRKVRGIYRSSQRVALVLFAIAILVTLATALAHGDITVGEMFAFFFGIAILVIPGGMALAAAPIASEGATALVEVMDFLNLEEVRPYQGAFQPDVLGAIRFDNVVFSYGDEPLLSNVTVEIEPGTVTMISGPNGSGKSSIINLMLGLFRPDEGQLSLDGTPYEEVNMTVLRQKIGLVKQEPTIVSGTIGDNIKYGVPEVSDVELWQAAHLATVDDFIVDFADGYNHDLGFDGRTLSAGQRQRIAIARALIRSPQLLILDEPTSHLDTGTLRRIITNISRLPSKPTVVITSHHPRAIDSVDHLYHLEGRRLIEDTGAVKPDQNS